jgi:uncharacterized protein (UPF0548 family)
VLATWSRPSVARLDAVLKGLAGQKLTYDEVGATKNTMLPSGYRHDRRSVSVGHGADDFRRAHDAIRHWEAHGAAGAIVWPADPSLVVGTATVVALRLGPGFVLAPCRIVYLTDEADRFGFAYGTLPGHPEQGEEAFHVQRSPRGEVTFGIIAFSRPADLLGRIGRPVARAVQNRVIAAYLEGVRRYVTNGR